MRLLLERPHGRMPLSRARLERTAARVLRAVKGASFAKGAEVSLVFAGRTKMRNLNRSYRGKDRVTDVLSFPQMEGPRFPAPPGEPRCLGDVVLCADVAARQARERGVPVGREVELLFVHGLLHLLGYDHATKRQEKRMFDLQESFVRCMRPRRRE